MAMPSLTGIGAMRGGLHRRAKLVAVDTDAWQTVPDIRPCLIVSVMNRYDVAVTAAILAAASGRTLPLETVNDFSTGGIGAERFPCRRPGRLPGANSMGWLPRSRMDHSGHAGAADRCPFPGRERLAKP